MFRSPQGLSSPPQQITATAVYCGASRLPSFAEAPSEVEEEVEGDPGGWPPQTRIVSCDRLVSTTIYPIWGLPINELYTSGPCRPLIRYPSEANLSVIFRSKVE